MIYCCGCRTEVNARLTGGEEIYPHRPDLSSLNFWKCDNCNNYVGCHKSIKNIPKPLGCIPTKEIKKARQHIHRILDPIWKGGKMERQEVYEKLSEYLGWNYHTAEIKSVGEARKVYKVVRKIANTCTY